MRIRSVKRNKDYRREKDKIDVINKYIFTNTSLQALSTLSEIPDLHGMLIALKGLFCPTNANKNRQIAENYKVVKTFNTKKQNVDI
ncbi:hypothetical protein K469DRAFT_611852 [Zopfia rhizophila CBS 207.26]|uniref:Uncharacterized protein n=1 Tax=Zopfia rhizophila CBS 207.26 TaxID=1314779 RepID=A0A6A6DA31_9PEZI|nr:hypothetical protein K469DRAFT_611852 [Zopfia rhizophila CBS 207.26]